MNQERDRIHAERRAQFLAERFRLLGAEVAADLRKLADEVERRLDTRRSTE